MEKESKIFTPRINKRIFELAADNLPLSMIADELGIKRTTLYEHVKACERATEDEPFKRKFDVDLKKARVAKNKEMFKQLTEDGVKEPHKTEQTVVDGKVVKTGYNVKRDRNFMKRVLGRHYPELDFEADNKDSADKDQKSRENEGYNPFTTAVDSEDDK